MSNHFAFEPPTPDRLPNGNQPTRQEIVTSGLLRSEKFRLLDSMIRVAKERESKADAPNIEDFLCCWELDSADPVPQKWLFVFRQLAFLSPVDLLQCCQEIMEDMIGDCTSCREEQDILLQVENLPDREKRDLAILILVAEREGLNLWKTNKDHLGYFPESELPHLLGVYVPDQLLTHIALRLLNGQTVLSLP